MTGHPDVIPGVLFGAASFAAMVFLCTLFFPIDRWDFVKGALLAWGLCCGMVGLVAVFIFVSMKIAP